MRLARSTAALASLAAAASLAACTSDGPTTSSPASSSRSSTATPANGDAAALSAALRSGVRNLTSAHFTITGSSGGQTFSGQGVQRVENGTLTGLQTTATLPAVGAVAIVVDGKDRFIKLPSSLATPGKPWAKVTANSKNVIVKQFSGLLDGALGAADLSSLDELAAAAKSVRKVGTARVSGAPATQYELVIDPAKLPNGVATAAGLGTADIPATIFVDGAGRPVRVRAKVPVAGEPVDLTVTFDRFGQPVTITRPPASQVATD